MIEAFVVAAERAEQAGFQGVEIHGAHGYILSASFCRPRSIAVRISTVARWKTVQGRYSISLKAFASAVAGTF